MRKVISARRIEGGRTDGQRGEAREKGWAERGAKGELTGREGMRGRKDGQRGKPREKGQAERGGKGNWFLSTTAPRIAQ